MTRLAPGSDARSIRRQRIGLALGSWTMAACLIIGQFLILRYLHTLNQSLAGTRDGTVVPSDTWRLAGAGLPLLLIAAALIMQICWLRSRWRASSVAALILLTPFSLICLFAAAVSGPGAVESVRLDHGQRITLANEQNMSEGLYALYENADPTGLTWRRISWLVSIPDGPFSDEPELVATADGNWLLARRSGIWTDAFRLINGHPIPLDVPLSGDLRLPNDAIFWRLRSERITVLTGNRP